MTTGLALPAITMTAGSYTTNRDTIRDRWIRGLGGEVQGFVAELRASIPNRGLCSRSELRLRSAVCSAKSARPRRIHLEHWGKQITGARWGSNPRIPDAGLRGLDDGQPSEGLGEAVLPRRRLRAAGNLTSAFESTSHVSTRTVSHSSCWRPLPDFSKYVELR